MYRIIATFNVLKMAFYKISQDCNEKIPAYATRIEGTLNEIRLKYQNRLDSAAVEGHLRE